MGEPATFSGTLVDLRPRTLLHFLGLTAKSGVLRARGHEREATVRFAAGRVVGGGAVDALVELLRLGNGEFSFEESTEPADAEGRPVADVLADAEQVAAEWEAVSHVVPSLGVVVRLRAGAGDGRLSGDAWDVVTAVAEGATTPSALADHLGWAALRACRAVRELVDGGRAELLAPARPRSALHGNARSVIAKAQPRAWHAADRPLWPGAGLGDGRIRTPWGDPGE